MTKNVFLCVHGRIYYYIHFEYNYCFHCKNANKLNQINRVPTLFEMSFLWTFKGQYNPF
jgi:hypothetical protein